MKGYMKGASTELELNKSKAPSNSSTTSKGASHHLRSCFRNKKKSLINRHTGRSQRPKKNPGTRGNQCKLAAPIPRHTGHQGRPANQDPSPWVRMR